MNNKFSTDGESRGVGELGGMPRPPRKEYAGALYHVTSRGNGRGRIFFEAGDYERFLSQMAFCHETYQVILHAYVLMPNHYHLLVRTPCGNLSRFMQQLNTSYALYARYKHGRPGHQLEGRYKAKVVQGDEYLLRLTWYIHLNPVKVKRMGGLGEKAKREYPEGYRWSSYRGYVGEREGGVDYRVLKGAGMAKAVAMELACRLTGQSQRDIGRRYGGISSQAVSQARRRVKEEVSPAELENLMRLIRSRHP